KVPCDEIGRGGLTRFSFADAVFLPAGMYHVTLFARADDPANIPSIDVLVSPTGVLWTQFLTRHYVTNLELLWDDVVAGSWSLTFYFLLSLFALVVCYRRRESLVVVSLLIIVTHTIT